MASACDRCTEYCQPGMLPSSWCPELSGPPSWRHSWLPIGLVSTSSPSGWWTDATGPKAPTLSHIVTQGYVIQYPQANKNTLRQDFPRPYRLLPRSQVWKGRPLSGRVKLFYCSTDTAPDPPHPHFSKWHELWRQTSLCRLCHLYLCDLSQPPVPLSLSFSLWKMEIKMPILCSVCKDQS